ncbi:hypothetical protein [Pseudomonas serbica]|jgi:hypothetical protein|uniref:hypothetical protein n=1 Tax=Pseudomonas serbica TaxID=2965074 RepID=UPI00237B5B28|nr:hypothetical protein [Pseudomonas serbica]
MVSISFKEMYGAYSSLLRDNLGKGLKLYGNEIVALDLDKDEVITLTLTEDGRDYVYIGSLDPRSWQDDEDAAKVIANPTFVDVSHLDFRRGD